MFSRFLPTFCAICYMSCSYSASQNQHNFKPIADSLHSIFINIRNDNSFDRRVALSDKAQIIFDSVLSISESFTYPFDTLKDVITCIYSHDKVCRIINWNIPHPDFSYSYFGYIQHYDKKNKIVTTTKLTDNKEKINNFENDILKADRWFGALYYEIIPTRVNKKEMAYVLLGWDGYSLNANRKVIEVMRFNKGIPYFGYDFFKIGSINKSRIIFTYNYRAKMKLSWNKSLEMIVFERLKRVPTLPPNLEGNMAPSMIFDAFKWKDNAWQYLKDIDVRRNSGKKRIRRNPYPY